jgi:hypothetical protein
VRINGSLHGFADTRKLGRGAPHESRKAQENRQETASGGIPFTSTPAFAGASRRATAKMRVAPPWGFSRIAIAIFSSDDFIHLPLVVHESPSFCLSRKSAKLRRIRSRAAMFSKQAALIPISPRVSLKARWKRLESVWISRGRTVRPITLRAS